MATRTSASRTPAKKAAAKAPAAKKVAAKSTPAKKPPAKKSPAKKVAAKSAPAKKVTVKTPAKKTVAKAAPAPRKAAVKKAAPRGRSRGLGDAAAAAPATLPADFFTGFTGELLSDADYAMAAQALGCEVAAIKAVAEVESKESPFDAKNRPTILYERHIFARATVPPGKFNASHPDLSAKVGYGPGGYGTKDQQYGKLARAFQLDPDAALKAPSWGKFQILGMNHKACGHATAAAFVKAMTISEREHLRAFVSFVAANPAMLQALRKKDWAAFALRYNGTDYAKFKYDQKMAAAYNKFA